MRHEEKEKKNHGHEEQAGEDSRTSRLELCRAEMEQIVDFFWFDRRSRVGVVPLWLERKRTGKILHAMLLFPQAIASFEAGEEPSHLGPD